MEGLATLRLTTGHSAGIYRAPELRLDHLASLQTLVLQRFSADILRLGAECELCVMDARFGNSEWADAPKNVGMIRFVPEVPLVTGAFPDFFFRLSNLHTVHLSVKVAGDPDNLVSLEPLAHVNRLCLWGEKLYLKVPSNVCWVDVIFSSGELMLVFDDVQGFADTVLECCVKFTTARGAWLGDLSSALSRAGICWGTAGSTPALTSFFYPEEWRNNFVDCSCGACLECLKRCLSADHV